MLQDWQYCKEDLVPSQELFSARVHFNFSDKIWTSWLFFLIFVRSDKAGLEQFGTSNKKKKAGGNTLSITTIITAFPMTSIATLPKISLFSDTFYDNRQSTNVHLPVPFLSPKSVFINKIFSAKQINLLLILYSSLLLLRK